METFPRQTLLTAAELMDVAIRRMEHITCRLQDKPLDPLETAGIPGDIRQLKKDYLALDDALQQSLFLISDQWPAIENNRTPRSPSSCRNIPGKCSRIMSEQIDVPYRPELSLCGAKNNLL